MNVWVGNLPEDATVKSLREFFAQFGKIRNVRVFKSFGFVDFEDLEAARKAVEASGT